MRLTRTLALTSALILAALIGGTLIGSALATDADPSAPAGADSTETSYCDTFLDAFASELGVTRDEIVAAGKEAALASIDTAVAAGDISEEHADRLREKVNEFDGLDCGLFRGGMGFGHHFGNGGPHGAAWLPWLGAGSDLLDSLADSLGVESSALVDALADAESLEAVASELGVDYAEMKAAVLETAEAALAERELPEDKSARMIERLTEWLDEGGPLHGGLGGWSRFGAPAGGGN
jgi:hypothetical protein